MDLSDERRKSLYSGIQASLKAQESEIVGLQKELSLEEKRSRVQAARRREALETAGALSEKAHLRNMSAAMTRMAQEIDDLQMSKQQADANLRTLQDQLLRKNQRISQLVAEREAPRAAATSPASNGRGAVVPSSSSPQGCTHGRLLSELREVAERSRRLLEQLHGALQQVEAHCQPGSQNLLHRCHDCTAALRDQVEGMCETLDPLAILLPTTGPAACLPEHRLHLQQVQRELDLERQRVQALQRDKQILSRRLTDTLEERRTLTDSLYEKLSGTADENFKMKKALEGLQDLENENASLRQEMHTLKGLERENSMLQKRVKTLQTAILTQSQQQMQPRFQRLQSSQEKKNRLPNQEAEVMGAEVRNKNAKQEETLDKKAAYDVELSPAFIAERAAELREEQKGFFSSLLVIFFPEWFDALAVQEAEQLLTKDGNGTSSMDGSEVTLSGEGVAKVTRPEASPKENVLGTIITP